MTDTWVIEQVEIIKRATKTASQSKETAIQFLEEAGIIEKPVTGTASNGKSPTKKKK